MPNAQAEAKKKHAKREARSAANDDPSALPPNPKYRAPANGRRLGGGANGGVEEGDEEALRRLRLKAIARQERKLEQQRAAGQGGRPPTQKPELKPGGSGGGGGGEGGEGFEAGGGGAEPCVGQPAVELQVKGLAGEVAEEVRVILGSVALEAGHALVGQDDAGAAGRAAEVVASTCRVVLRNARENPERRTLKASNAAVWDKLVRWRGGRRLLVLAGFSFAPPPPEDQDGVDVWLAWREGATVSLAASDVSPGTPRWQALEAALAAALGTAALPAAPTGGGASKGGAEEDAAEEPPCCSARRGKLSGGEDVFSWLSGFGLEKYAEPLVLAGYDDPFLWPHLTADEVDEMASIAGMLPGHRAKLAAALRSQRAMPPAQVRGGGGGGSK